MRARARARLAAPAAPRCSPLLPAACSSPGAPGLLPPSACQIHSSPIAAALGPRSLFRPLAASSPPRPRSHVPARQAQERDRAHHSRSQQGVPAEGRGGAGVRGRGAGGAAGTSSSARARAAASTALPPRAAHSLKTRNHHPNPQARALYKQYQVRRGGRRAAHLLRCQLG